MFFIWESVKTTNKKNALQAIEELFPTTRDIRKDTTFEEKEFVEVIVVVKEINSGILGLYLRFGKNSI